MINYRYDYRHRRTAARSRGMSDYAVSSKFPRTIARDKDLPNETASYGKPVSDRIREISDNTSSLKRQREYFHQQAIGIERAINDIGGTEGMTVVESFPIAAQLAVDPTLPEPEETKPASFLVRPEDISNAADSTDLLDTLLSENLNRIEDKNDLRMRENWASKERDKIRNGYYKRASDAYMKMWNTCNASEVGHNYITVDVRGTTVHTCQVCSYSYWEDLSNNPHPVSNAVGSDYYKHEKKKSSKSAEYSNAREMNLSFINSMKTRMIELDEEAGLLDWPSADDYDPGKAMIPPLVGEGSEKVKKWFAKG